MKSFKLVMLSWLVLAMMQSGAFSQDLESVETILNPGTNEVVYKLNANDIPGSHEVELEYGVNMFGNMGILWSAADSAYFNNDPGEDGDAILFVDDRMSLFGFTDPNFPPNVLFLHQVLRYKVKAENGNVLELGYLVRPILSSNTEVTLVNPLD